MKKSLLLLSLGAMLALVSCGGGSQSSSSESKSSTPEASSSQPASVTSEESKTKSEEESSSSTEALSSESSESVDSASSEESSEPEVPTELDGFDAIDVFYQNLLSPTYEFDIIRGNDLEGDVEYFIDALGSNGYVSAYRASNNEYVVDGLIQLKDLGGYFQARLDDTGEVVVRNMKGNATDHENPTAASIYGAFDIGAPYAGKSVYEELIYIQDLDDEYHFDLDLSDKDVLAYGINIAGISIGDGTGFNSKVFDYNFATLSKVALDVDHYGQGGVFTFEVTWDASFKEQYGLPTDTATWMVAIDNFEGDFENNEFVTPFLDYINGDVRPGKPTKFADKGDEGAVFDQLLPWYDGFDQGLVLDVKNNAFYDYTLGQEAVDAYANLLKGHDAYEEVENEEEGSYTFELNLDPYGENVIVFSLGLVASNSTMFDTPYFSLSYELDEGRPITDLTSINLKIADTAEEYNVPTFVVPSHESVTSYTLFDYTEEYNLYNNDTADFYLEVTVTIESVTNAEIFVTLCESAFKNSYPEAEVVDDVLTATLGDGRVASLENDFNKEDYQGVVNFDFKVEAPLVIDAAWVSSKIAELNSDIYDQPAFGIYSNLVDIPAEAYNLVSSYENGQFVHMTHTPMASYPDYTVEAGQLYVELNFNTEEARDDFLNMYINTITQNGYVLYEGYPVYYEAASPYPTRYGGLFQYLASEVDAETGAAKLTIILAANYAGLAQ